MSTELKNKDLTSNDAKPMLCAGQIVWLDADLSHKSKVRIHKIFGLFATVSSNGVDTWDVMTRRLSPCT